jgi:DNA polymerase
MEEAGLAPQDCYVTNVVKHFKFEWQGKRRLHKKPRQLEINACLPWLTAELEVVDPSIVVCLGATAAQALLGRNFKVSVERGKWIKTETDRLYFATVHPSSILRAVDAQARHEQQTEFIGDLMLVTEKLRELKSIAESK